MTAVSKTKILFLCTGNSCRSQMAEGWARKLKGNDYEFHSAGTKQHGMNPHAIEVMREVGIDLSAGSGHFSKTTEQLPGGLRLDQIDVIFTVCSDADENCPHVPGARVIHTPFDDPPRLTANIEDPEERLAVYRRVRDEIRDFVEQLDSHLG